MDLESAPHALTALTTDNRSKVQLRESMKPTISFALTLNLEAVLGKQAILYYFF